MVDNKFSVLLAVYYKEKPENLRDSLSSIENQTLKAEEIVLIKDGELTEDLEMVIIDYSKRIPLKVFGYKENKGLAYALNFGLSRCTYEIVMRADSDDICLPTRFEKQFNFLQKNKCLAVISSWIEERFDISKTGVIKKLPLTHDEIVKYSKKRNPINHPATAFRKSIILKVGGYPNLFPEDYALWLILLKKNYQFSNINEVLVIMRTDEDFLQRRGVDFLKGEIRIIQFQKKLGLINGFEMLFNVMARTILRVLPIKIKKIIYKVYR